MPASPLMRAILSVDGWSTMTPAALLAHFASVQSIRKSETDARFSAADLMRDPALGVQTVEQLVAALRTAGFVSTANSLEARGLDFSSDQVQQMLATLGQQLPQKFTPTIVSHLQALGIDRRTWWERNAAGPLPTESEISSAIASHLLEARITNATALMSERLAVGQTSQQQAAIVAQAWTDAT